MGRKRGTWRRLGGLLLPLIAVLVLLGFATGLNSLDAGRGDEDKRQLERALHRGCMACYAAEGVYPPDLEHLRERYGIQIDDTRYEVMYSAFAENLLPDITVLERVP